MDNKYKAVNIRDLLDENSKAHIGEDALKVILSDFSCKPNIDVLSDGFFYPHLLWEPA